MGQLKIIELTETYTGIKFLDLDKIQSESQSLSRKWQAFLMRAASQACHEVDGYESFIGCVNSLLL